MSSFNSLYNEFVRSPRQRSKKVIRKSNLSRYGITIEDYDRLLLEQDNKCAICKSTWVGRVRIKNFAVDHDHATGKVRGLLCHGCNHSLGEFKDSVELLRNAITYLEKHK